MEEEPTEQEEESEDFDILGLSPASQGDLALDRELRAFSGEERLIAGVLKTAIVDFQGGCREAEDWIFLEGNSTLWTFSFEFCCTVLHLEVSFVRRLARESRDQVFGGRDAKREKRRLRVGHPGR